MDDREPDVFGADTPEPAEEENVWDLEVPPFLAGRRKRNKRPFIVISGSGGSPQKTVLVFPALTEGADDGNDPEQDD